MAIPLSDCLDSPSSYFLCQEAYFVNLQNLFLHHLKANHMTQLEGSFDNFFSNALTLMAENDLKE
jgi:hypothetical protein